jgi:PBP1b-binding outer membrane lipoprotein LpoB
MVVNKKIIIILLSLLFLNGCVQSSAFLGPTITVATTGNIANAGFQYGTNVAVKKETGKDTVEYISSVLNPPQKKTLSEDFIILVENRIKETRKIIFKKNN